MVYFIVYEFKVTSLFYVCEQQVFLPTRHPTMTRDKAHSIVQQVLALMEKDHAYRESNIKLTSVADHLGVKPYLVSQALGVGLGKSFPELVNQYRIEEAKRRLTDLAFHHYSIEAIAFDCGFSMPSTFYTSFKKFTSQTPGEFKAKVKSSIT
jgi:AraC-like DNA-binding protein